MKKSSLRILLSLILCTSLCAVILSVSAAPAQNSDMAYSIDTPYEYPITPDSEEWFATDSHATRVSYCQIPEDILGNMSTAALVETVANYPLLGDLLFFNRAEDAYQSVSCGFNGLRELECRPDALDELIRFIQSSETVQDDFVRRTALGVVVLAGDFPVPYASTGRDDFSSLQDVFSDVYKCYRELAAVGLDSEDESVTRSTDEPKTPSGEALKEYHYSTFDDLDWSASDIKDLNSYVKDKYNLTPIRQPTVKYNCHSYAWYKVDLPNYWWISYPDDYINDPLVTRVGAPRVGDRIVYRISQAERYTHSGIISSVPASGTATADNIWITSKWGALGLYRHTIHNCPNSVEDGRYGELTEYWHIN